MSIVNSGFSFSSGYYPYITIFVCAHYIKRTYYYKKLSADREEKIWVRLQTELAYIVGFSVRFWLKKLWCFVFGCDGSGNIEWQSLLGQAAEAAASGIRMVAAVAQATRRD